MRKRNSFTIRQFVWIRSVSVVLRGENSNDLIRTNLGRCLTDTEAQWLSRMSDSLKAFQWNKPLQFKIALSFTQTESFFSTARLTFFSLRFEAPENGKTETSFLASLEAKGYFKSETELLCNSFVINLHDAVALENYGYENGHVPLMIPSTALLNLRGTLAPLGVAASS